MTSMSAMKVVQLTDFRSCLILRLKRSRLVHLQVHRIIHQYFSSSKLSRLSKGYIDGVRQFLDFAFANGSKGGLILCPCKTCNNCLWKDPDEVYNHLICKGIDQGYIHWIYHGERSSPSVSVDDDIGMGDESNMHDDVKQLVQDVMRQEGYDDHMGYFEDNEEEGGKDPNLDAKIFFELMKDCLEDVYLRCKKSNKLSFLIRLLNIKGKTGCSNATITMFLELLKSILPEGETLPKSYSEAAKIMKGLGLEYEKIDACCNDCMIFWENYVEATSCHICGASRWEGYHEDQDTTEAMRWHEKSRTKDGKLRHPADSQAWKDFDSLFPDFAANPRNEKGVLCEVLKGLKIPNSHATNISRYLDDSVETRFNRPYRNYDDAGMDSQKSGLFPRMGHFLDSGEISTLDFNSWIQAHRYFLVSYVACKEHEKLIMQCYGSRKWNRARSHSLEFHEWFKTRVRDQQVLKEIKLLSPGPSRVVRRLKGFIVNGFRFHTQDREKKIKTQNSGVVITALTESYASSQDQNPIKGNVTYYGVLKDIIELDYYGHFNVVVFKCDWFQVKQDEFGFLLVNFTRSNEDIAWQIDNEPNVSFSDPIINVSDDSVSYSRDDMDGEMNFEVQHFASQGPPSLVDDNFENEENPEDLEAQNEIFADVMGHNKAGHVSLYGRGVTASDLKKKPPSFDSMDAQKMVENARRVAMDEMKEVKDKLEEEMQKMLEQQVQSIKIEMTDQVLAIKSEIL
ncbi:hypothetical protein POUND7_017540 [Theobroma cacao]